MHFYTGAAGPPGRFRRDFVSGAYSQKPEGDFRRAGIPDRAEPLPYRERSAEKRHWTCGGIGNVHRRLWQQLSSETGDAKAYVGVLLRTLWRGLAPVSVDPANHRRVSVEMRV